MGAELPQEIEFFLTVFLGLIFGSFCTAVTFRELNDKIWFSLKANDNDSWSACPACGHRLKLVDLVPLFSWFITLGRCRYCKSPVSALYPLIEILNVLCCLGIYFCYDFSISSLFLMALIPFFIAMIIIDIKRLILPDRLVFICLVLAIVYSFIVLSGTEWLLPDFNYLIGGIALPLIMFVVSWVCSVVMKKQVLGRGDIKLMVPAGLLTGFSGIPLFLILAGSLGILSGLIARLNGGRDAFPFGPAIILSVYVIILIYGL